MKRRANFAFFSHYLFGLFFLLGNTTLSSCKKPLPFSIEDGFIYEIDSQIELKSEDILDEYEVEPDTGKEFLDAADIVDHGQEEFEEFIEIVEDSNEETAITKPPERKCGNLLKYDSMGKTVSSVAVPGEFNSWDSKALKMSDTDKDGVFEVFIEEGTIAPGEYGYKFLINDKDWILDPANPYSKFVGGVENSKLIVGDCSVPEIRLNDISMDSNKKSVQLEVAFYGGSKGEGISIETMKGTHNGMEMNPTPDSGFVWKIDLAGLENGKHVFRFFASNDYGEADPLYVPVWIEDKEFSWNDAILYFPMIDRFLNGDGGNDKTSGCIENNIANWKGGDFAGITKKIKDGYFEALGINALWISPVIDNPEGCYMASDRLYTAYHGYFPIDLYDTEEHFGSIDELKELVAEAHKRGIRVLLDLVINHVHDEAELYKTHAFDGWFNPYYKCGYDEKPIECWFQPYMPDFDFKNNDAVNEVVKHAVFWIEETGADGFRVDAVKHVEHAFLRALRAEIERKTSAGNLPFVMIGETFVGDWGGGSGQAENKIKEYVNAWELNGQFNFPLYWEVVRTFARGESSFVNLWNVIEQSKDFYGADAVMSNFAGNHDIPRLISHSNGDISDIWGNAAKEQAWTNPPGQPQDEKAFKRAAMAFTFLMTLKGIPLIYYGDEVGLAGAGDPDNRRMMPWSGLTQAQNDLREHIEKVAKIRNDNPQLRGGDYKKVVSEIDVLIYSKSDIIVAFNRTTQEIKKKISGSGTLKDLISDKTFSGSGEIEISIPALSSMILKKM